MSTATQKTDRQILREKHKDERKQLREKEAILEAVPVAPQLICVHAFHPASINYRTAERFPARYSIAQAVAILDAWRPYIIPAQHWKDSCVSVMPDCARSKPPGEFAELKGESAIEISLSAGLGDGGGRGYESHEISFFARIGERVLSVDIEFAPRPEWLPHHQVDRDSRTGRILSSKFIPRVIGENKRIGWWNPPGSYGISYYWNSVESWDNWLKGVL